MAHIRTKATLMISAWAGRPSFILNPGPPARWTCLAAPFQLSGSTGLEGKPGEQVGGWTLGFVQLYYLGSIFARYRGESVKDGSALVAIGHKRLCRDTEPGTHEIWYDPLHGTGPTGPLNTNRLAHGTVLRDTGDLLFEARLQDRPQIEWPIVHQNKKTGKPNYLHYTNVEILFCTMLVARTPEGHHQALKHIYWNVIGEATFKRVGTTVALDRTIRLQQNQQSGEHDGVPNDLRFLGREYDLRLPIGNDVISHPRIVDAVDWSEG